MEEPPTDDVAIFELSLSDFCRHTPAVQRELNDIVARNHATLTERWVKKLKQKNKARRFFREIWPDIPMKHREDMDVDQENPEEREAPRRQVYLWPHLNQDDLVANPTTLLRLIHYRARRSWLEYTDIDLDSTKGGWRFPNVRNPLPWLEAYLLGKRAKSIDYRVTFRECNEHDTDLLCYTVDKTVTEDQRREVMPYTFNYAEAVLIAEVQCHLYRFLVDVCKQVLLPKNKEWTEREYTAKFNEEFILSKPYPASLPAAPRFTPNGLSSTGGAAKNLSEMRRYSWYDKPGDLDLQTVGGLIRARVADAEEAILDLRSYPDFFEEMVRRWKDVYDQASPTEKHKGASEFANDQLPGWKWAVEKAVVDAIKTFDRWTALEKCLSSLEVAYRENGLFLSLSNNSLKAVVAKKMFLRELISFKHMAFALAEINIAELKAEIDGKAPFDRYFQFTPDNDDSDSLKIPRRTEGLRKGLEQGKDNAGEKKPGEGEAKEGQAGKSKASKGEVEKGPWLVFEKFRSILEDEQRMRFGLPAVLGELDRVIDDEEAPENADVLPSHVRPTLEDLGVLAECLIQVENFRPWSSIIHPMMQDRQQMSRAIAQVEQLEIPLRRLYDHMDKIFHMTYLRGIPYDKRFEYPPLEVERTEEVIKILKTSGENLDRFWEGLLPKLKLQHALSSGLQTLLEHKPCHTQPWTISIARTSTGGDWEEEAETHKAEDNTKGQSLHDEMQARLQGLQVTATPVVSSQSGSVGTPPESVEEISSPQVVVAAPADRRIRVSARTLQTLRMLMFDVHRRGPAPGELAWDDLKAAMIDIGFGMTTGSGGSEWNFHPGTSLGLTSPVPIKFHNPHPRRKLSAKLARQYGRRVCKRYQWTLDSFTER